jgi:ribosome-associated protein
LEVARTVVNALEEKKGENIVLLDIQGIAIFADYFVICSGTSDRMLKSLSDAALEKVREISDIRGRVEGQALEGWVVVDFGDVVLHLFSPDQRDYYRLEELWEAGKVLLRLQ